MKRTILLTALTFVLASQLWGQTINPGEIISVCKHQTNTSEDSNSKLAVKGLEITGDPESSDGATWIFQDTLNNTYYDLKGILFKPAVNKIFPAVIINHGSGGSVESYSKWIAMEMRTWGYVGIAVNYTHSNDLHMGSPGTIRDQGASTANVKRAMLCWYILSGLGYADTNRIAVFGHSAGAFVAIAVTSSFPGKFCAAAHTSGGISSNIWPGFIYPDANTAQGIKCPYLMHHGEKDNVVPIAWDRNLQTVLNNNGVPNNLFVYAGYDHNQVMNDTLMFSRTKEWFDKYCLGITNVLDEVIDKQYFTLDQNYPNPFNPTTTISYTLPKAGNVRITILDVLGKEVFELADENKTAGKHSVVWNAGSTASGIYFCRITSNNHSLYKKMILLK